LTTVHASDIIIVLVSLIKIMKKIVWLLVVIVLAIILVGVLTNKDLDEYVFDNFIDESNAVVLAEQVPGNRTVVSYTKLSEPGYVLVYREDENGDRVFLGSSDLIPMGDSFNVVVRHRNGMRTSSGTKVFAIAVSDNGDGVFDGEIDNNQIAQESEVDVDAGAQDPSELTIAEIGELIEDAGFDVTAEEALETNDSQSTVDTSSEVMNNETETDNNDETDTEMGVDATVETETAIQ